MRRALEPRWAVPVLVAALITLSPAVAWPQPDGSYITPDRPGEPDDGIRLAVSALSVNAPFEVQETALTTLYLRGVLEKEGRSEIERSFFRHNVLQAVKRCEATCQPQARSLAKKVLKALLEKLEWQPDGRGKDDQVEAPAFDRGDSKTEAQIPLAGKVIWLSLPPNEGGDYAFSSSACGLDWAVTNGLRVRETGSIQPREPQYVSFSPGMRLRLERAGPCVSGARATVILRRHRQPQLVADPGRAPIEVDFANAPEVSYRLELSEQRSFNFVMKTTGPGIYEIGTRNLNNTDTTLKLWRGEGEDRVLLAADDDGRQTIEDLSSRLFLHDASRIENLRTPYFVELEEIGDSESPESPVRADVYFRRSNDDPWRSPVVSSPPVLDLSTRPYIELRSEFTPEGRAEANRLYQSGIGAGASGSVELFCDAGQWLEFRVAGTPARLTIEGLSAAESVDYDRFRAICERERSVKVTVENLGGTSPLLIMTTSRPAREADVIPRWLYAEKELELELDTLYRLVLNGPTESRHGEPGVISEAQEKGDTSSEEHKEPTSVVLPLPCDEDKKLRISFSRLSTGFNLLGDLQTRPYEKADFDHAQPTESGEEFWLSCKPRKTSLLAIDRASGAADLLVRDVTPQLHPGLDGKDINPGDTLKGALYGELREQWAAFRCGRDGRRYAVETFDLDGVDTKLELLSGFLRNIVIDQDDDGREDEEALASRLEWTCERSVYSFKVTGYEETAGTFKLRLLELE